MKKLIWVASLCASLLAFEATANPAKQVEILNFGAEHNYPFSSAARVGNMLFMSGALGIAPDTDAVVQGGIRAETRQTMENIKATAKASGYEMKNIVKCTVFLADMAEWPAFNDVYRTYFNKPYPARSAVAVRGLAADARVEVECIAAK